MMKTYSFCNTDCNFLICKTFQRNPNNTNNTDPVLEKVLNVVVPSKLRIITQPLSGYAGQIINPTIKVCFILIFPANFVQYRDRFKHLGKCNDMI